MSSPSPLSTSNSSSSSFPLSSSMSTVFVDNKTGEEYEFLGTSIQFSEKALIALETDHDKQIDSFVQDLIEDGYFDDDWDEDQEEDDDEEEDDEDDLKEEEEKNEIEEDAVEAVHGEIAGNDDKKVIHLETCHVMDHNQNIQCIVPRPSFLSVTPSRNKDIPCHTILAHNVRAMRITFRNGYVDCINAIN